MRKKDIELLQAKLLNMKIEIEDVIKQSRNNIHDLNGLRYSEEGDISSCISMSKIDEKVLIKYQSDLKEIDFALQKINNNKYGVCEMCDEEIDINRLKIKPHARFCIRCREIYEKTRARSANAI